MKSSNVSEHKFKLNPHFKSFNGEDIKLLNDSNKDWRVNITVGNIKNADIILPDQSNDIKKKNHEHVIHWAQGLKACKSKELPKGIVQLGNNEIIQKNHDQNLKLLVFDLDETLMHTVHHFEDDNVENHKIDKEFDFKLPILYPNGKTKYIWINMRPYVKEVLHLLKKYYRIVIFTASVPSYADTILNFIDPSNSIFEARYYRSHWLASKDRIHIKDMRLFEQPNSKNDKNWDLKDIVIVDNASHSFAYQVNNGYPILPFYSDKQDKEMIHLYHYLKRLADHDDVRPVIAKTFVLDKLLQERISELIDGIIEYSVQEMTDEDMMLFDKYFSSQNESIQNLSSFELEQGQSVETTINADITNTNDDNFEEIVDVIHVEVDDNFQQENYNSLLSYDNSYLANKSWISIPKERYSIDVENFKRSYHLHNNGSQGEVKVSGSIISQIL